MCTHKKKLILIEHVLGTKHSTECFTSIILHNPQNPCEAELIIIVSMIKCLVTCSRSQLSSDYKDECTYTHILEAQA